ncbi:hypothetical protein [Paenibacillus thermotolerans]|nr:MULTISPECIES: hypothetical protein [unclassified Paenibacillus]
MSVKEWVLGGFSGWYFIVGSIVISYILVRLSEAKGKDKPKQ